MTMTAIETVELKSGTQRVLREDELDAVAGGFTGNDGGCCPTITWDRGGVIHFPIGFPIPG
jgi:hypothetical protein